MSKELRRSGIDIIGDVGWGTHFCQFYRTAQDLLDILVPYFMAGLQDNEFCMWITSEPLGQEAAERALAGALPDFESYVRKGQIEILSYTDWYLRGGVFDSGRVLAAWVAKLEAARATGFEGLRLSGNTFWLEDKDWRAFTDYEAAVDGVISRYRMLAACTYSLDRCGANEVLDVVRNHRFALVRREAKWELVESADSKRADDAIRRLAQFPEKNPNPVFRVDGDGSLLYANPPARDCLAALGGTPAEPVPEAIRSLAAEASASDKLLQRELADGQGRVFWFTASHPPGEDHVNLYAHDITKRKRAEQTLRESEEKYRRLFETMAEGFALYELVDDAQGRPVDWRVLEVNEAYTRHTGTPREKIVGRLVGEVFPAAVADYLPTFVQVVETGVPVDFETYAKAVGRYQHVVTFPAGGRRFANIVEDITARRKTEEALRVSEERYRALFENMNEGFALHEIVTDGSGRPVDYRFIDINPAFERLTGLRRTEVMGRTVREVLQDIEPFWIETYGRVALTGEPASFERYFPAPLDRWYGVFAYRPAPRQFAVVFVDTSQRRRDEDALRQSELRLRRASGLLEAVTRGTGVLIATVDRDFRYTYFNEEHHRELKKLTSRDTRIGMSLMEALEGMPDQLAAALELWGRAMNGESIDRTTEFGEPGGYRRSYRTQHTPILDERGGVIGAGEVTSDITEQLRDREALRQSEARLARAQEIARLGSWEFETAANQLTWSDEVYRIFGLAPREFGATYEAFLAAVHPDDRARVDKAYAASLRQASASFEIEYRIVRRDTGEVRTVHTRSENTIDAAGRVVRSVGMLHDITERKQAEALRQALAEQERLRLGAAVEQSSDAVVMVDLDGRIQYVNAAFESINLRSKSEAVGRDYVDLVGEVPCAEEIRKAVKTGEAWHGLLTRPRQGERPVELEVTISPAKDPAGGLLGVLITERDVTAETILRQEVHRAQKMEALGTLAGGITHDFNNILGAIVINTELALLDLDKDSPARESLPMVLKAANRGRDLVKQIVTFSRQRERERRPVQIAPTIKEGLKLLRSTFPDTIKLHESILAGSEAVLADPAQLHQILSNLCQNAVLAIAGGPGSVEVKLEAVQVDSGMAARHPDLKPGPYIRLSVGDSGCGMSPETIDRIFEPFFTTRRHGEGSGLGLPVVHGIVRSYGGAISVYSEIGKGSVFSIFLPRLESAAPAPEAGPDPKAARGKECILFVEDDKAQLVGMSKMLGRLGYKVTARSGARTALTAFKKSPEAFDLVITDQTMPRMTGVDLAQAIMKIRTDIPIILCTGFSEKVNGETVGHFGIRAFIMKPFTAREVTDLIRKVLKDGG